MHWTRDDNGVYHSNGYTIVRDASKWLLMDPKSQYESFPTLTLAKEAGERWQTNDARKLDLHAKNRALARRFIERHGEAAVEVFEEALSLFDRLGSRTAVRDLIQQEAVLLQQDDREFLRELQCGGDK